MQPVAPQLIALELVSTAGPNALLATIRRIPRSVLKSRQDTESRSRSAVASLHQLVRRRDAKPFTTVKYSLSDCISRESHSESVFDGPQIFIRAGDLAPHLTAK